MLQEEDASKNRIYSCQNIIIQKILTYSGLEPFFCKNAELQLHRSKGVFLNKRIFVRDMSVSKGA